MRIVINTENIDLYNTFYKVGKDTHQIINAKIETVLFDAIEKSSADAYVLSNDTPYFKKAVDFIKKSAQYIPVIVIIKNGKLTATQADINLPYSNDPSFVNCVFHNIEMYTKTFSTLQRLTAKMNEKIEFGKCVYDPTRRMLSHNGVDIKKLSAKEGGILEILAINFGQVVKKEVILEKVWRKTDYFAGRSMDVYITYLRNTLKENEINLTITNISGVGLILE